MALKETHEHEELKILTDPKEIEEGRLDDDHGIITHPWDKEFLDILQHDGENLVLTMKRIAKGLKSRKNVHCPNCGGLTPELVIVFDGKFYFFTCHEVKDLKTNKILLQTDYKQLKIYAEQKPLLDKIRKKKRTAEAKK